jgi:hypothetical protein
MANLEETVCHIVYSNSPTWKDYIEEIFLYTDSRYPELVRTKNLERLTPCIGVPILWGHRNFNPWEWCFVPSTL